MQAQDSIKGSNVNKSGAKIWHQTKALPFSINKSTAKWLGWLFKIGLFVASIWGVWFQLGEKDLLHKLFGELQLLQGFQPLLLFALLLIPFNWGLEALKWQFLARKLEPITWFEALEGVVTGVALGFWTPQFIGDYAGRTLQLQTTGRSRSAGALMLSNASQFIVSFVVGCMGLFFFSAERIWPFLPALEGISITLTAISLVMVVMFFNSRLFAELADKALPKSLLARVLSILKEYSERELSVVLLISALRYAVFASQFYLLFRLFGLDLPADILLPGIAIIYLVKTIIPSLNIVGDLGLREISALLYFQQFGGFQEKVVAASLLLWCINLLIPTLAGIVLIWRIKLLPGR